MGARKSKAASGSTTTTNLCLPPAFGAFGPLGTLPNFGNLALSNFAGPLGLPFGSTLGPLAQLPPLASIPPPTPLGLPPLPQFANLGPIAGFGNLSNLSNLSGLNPFLAGHIGNSPLLPLAFPTPAPFNGFVGF